MKTTKSQYKNLKKNPTDKARMCTMTYKDLDFVRKNTFQASNAVYATIKK